MDKFALILLCWLDLVSGNETKVTDCSRGGDQDRIFNRTFEELGLKWTVHPKVDGLGRLWTVMGRSERSE